MSGTSATWLLLALGLCQGCPEPDPRLLDAASVPPLKQDAHATEPPEDAGPKAAPDVAPEVEDTASSDDTVRHEVTVDGEDTQVAMADSAPLPELPPLPPLERRETSRPELEPPAAVIEGAKRTEDGLPIIAESSGGAISVTIAYDSRLDDPVARWGDCLSLVVRCRQQTEGAILPCVDAILRCTGNGGEACCPDACLAPFVARLRAGEDELAAFEATVLAGDCMPGLSELRGKSRALLELE